MTPEVFQAALERGDIETAGEMLADNVVFRSPAVFEPYEGKPATLVLLKAVSRVFQDFRYVRTFLEEDGRGMALMFEAKVGTRHVEGVDLLRLDAHGLVDDFRVMVRPHSALEALMTAMVPMIELVLADQGSRSSAERYSTVTPAARISFKAASVVSGATPAHRSDKHRGGEALGHRVDRGRAHAVVGREAADVDLLDLRARATTRPDSCPSPYVPRRRSTPPRARP